MANTSPCVAPDQYSPRHSSGSCQVIVTHSIIPLRPSPTLPLSHPSTPSSALVSVYPEHALSARFTRTALSKQIEYRAIIQSVSGRCQSIYLLIHPIKYILFIHPVNTPYQIFLHPYNTPSQPTFSDTSPPASFTAPQPSTTFPSLI